MIFLLVALASDAPAASPFTQLMREYRECVSDNALTFERAKEPVAGTVDGAFSACQNQRASVILYMSDTDRKDGGKIWQLNDADKFVVDLVDKGLRHELTAKLFRMRSR